jgi:hypothetical protein
VWGKARGGDHLSSLTFDRSVPAALPQFLPNVSIITVKREREQKSKFTKL